mmetsp:Transcript_18701/g.33943  ORF Transcript_18701/g.33943 Transcript_18701/m.33943 type:complete len:204 (-) Transcript_18701:420-1031(-)
MSVFDRGTRIIAEVRGPDGFIVTSRFLDVCRLVVPVVEKLGTAFALVKADVGGNIDRLETMRLKDPERNLRLFTLIQDEIISKRQSEYSSCSRGLLWLKRAMEFMIAILTRLQQDDSMELTEVVQKTYEETLMKYHGFIASTAFTLAFKFVPTRQDFVSKLADGCNLAICMKDMKIFCDAFSAILADVNKFLVLNGLDDQSKV